MDGGPETRSARAHRLRASLPSINPVWLKAPFVLLRFPALLVAMVAAAVVVAIAAASGPLMLSSVGNAALNREISTLSKESAGLTVTTFGRVIEKAFERTDQALKDSVSSMEELGRASVTILTPSTRVGTDRRPGEAHVRLLSRTDARSHVDIVSQVDRPGVLMAQSTAALLAVHPGQTIELRRGDLTAEIRVAAIYRDLASRPITEFWRPMTFQIVSPIANQAPLDPFLIATRRALFNIKEKIPGERGGFRLPGESGTFRWEFPLVPAILTVRDATEVTSEIHRIRDEANDPLSDLGASGTRFRTFDGLEVDSLLPEMVRLSENTVAALEGSARLISLAGVIVGLMVIGAAGMFSFNRRSVEVRLLSAQGVHPLAQGAKASLEGSLPIALAVPLGWTIALLLTRELGPTSIISAGVPAQALKTVALAAAVAVTLLGIVFGVVAGRDAQIGSTRPRRLLARIPWEAIALSLAGASLYEIWTRGGPVTESRDGPAHVDVFLLAFPLFFMVGLGVLAARGLVRLLPLLRTRRESSSTSLFLASRRLAASSRGALVLVAASAIALGVLVYSSTVVATTDATADAKAMVLAGSEVAAVPASQDSLPEEFPFPATLVSKTSVDLFPGDIDADVLAIDSSTFANAAFWDDSFADRSLDDLLSEISAIPGPRVPAVVAGWAGTATTLERGGDHIAIRAIARARVWPGMAPNTPLIVVDRDSMEQALAALGSTLADPLTRTELWARSDPETVLDSLSRMGVVIEDSRSAEEVRSTPALVSLSWTFSFLQGLGIMAGAIALVGMVLYLQARQQSREVAYALARKMGLSPRAHGLAVIIELAVLLVIAFAVGAVIALVAARLISSQLDPLPELPPAPLFEFPAMVLWVTPIALVVASVFGAWRVQRSADRMKVAEVMRIAG